MADELTHDEHVTRAMLMGMTYDATDDTYEPAGWGDKPGWDGLIDARTMQPIDIEDVEDWYAWCSVNRPHLIK